ncbi:MAG: RNA polymerase factor sigma-54 [Gammaproteobacteria bacterium]|nr:RNA polymerase factor sigma-54 [Gammaproteobacteria bacterium]
MKQSLQLKIGQQLTMTPQLQQAIKLLQLSSLDLQSEIQEALDSNMMLEVDDSHDDNIQTNEENTYSDPTELLSTNEVSTKQTSDETSIDNLSKQVDEVLANERQQKSSSDKDSSPDTAQVDFEDIQNTIPSEISSDTDWDEIFDSNAIHASSNAPNYNNGNSDLDYLENASQQGESIQQYLESQLELTPMTDIDREIASTIIDSINESGFLEASIEELCQTLSYLPDVEKEEIEAVLHLIQTFDPPGVAAKDLQECLLIQLNLLDPDTSLVNEAKLIISRYLNLLASRDLNTLKRRTKIGEDTLKSIIKLITSLNPRPAGQITQQNTQYIIPDVIVKKINGVWHAELNQESVPPLTINKEYLALIKEMKNSPDSTNIKDHLQEARWFIKSIQSRNDTLIRVARCILDFQQDFFNYGDEYMKALVLADIAEVVGMHESTISRVTTQKYMHTPKGVFELKYFFSSHVSTASGGEASATAIRAIIKKIISQENTLKPLSDNKLSQMLAEQNYNVARRTVAKYRESMSIPPSNERKTLV